MQIGILIVAIVVIVALRISHVKNLNATMEKINMDEEWETAQHDPEKMARTISEKTGLEYLVCLKQVDMHFLKDIPMAALLQENVHNFEYTTDLIYEQTHYDKVRIRKNLEAEYEALQELVKLQERASFKKQK